MQLTFPNAVTPMYWRRDFPGMPDQARVVRSFASQLLTGHPALDDVLLVLNELVVNAIRHTRSGQDGGTFSVEILRGAGVAVSVADQGGLAEPVATTSADLCESGRGLSMVSLTAASWSWHGNEDGRSVTAAFTSDTASKGCSI